MGICMSFSLIRGGSPVEYELKMCARAGDASSSEWSVLGYEEAIKYLSFY